MAMPVAVSDLKDQMELLAGLPFVRMFTMNESGLPTDKDEYSYDPVTSMPGATWLRGDQLADVERMSAIGFSFARELAIELKVPVAVYDLACCNTCIHSWLPRSAVERDSVIKNHVREIQHYRDRENWNQISIEKKPESDNNILADSEKDQPPSVLSGTARVGKRPPRRDESIVLRNKDTVNRMLAIGKFRRRNQPAAMFNHKLAPLTGLALRGVLWYQGESDSNSPDYYRKALMHLANAWVRLFVPPVGGLKMLYCQLTPNYYTGYDFKELAVFNEMLSTVRRSLPLAAGIAATHDLPLDYDPLAERWGLPRHPRAKREIGLRFKQLALGLAYRRDQPGTSPECSEVERVGNKLMLSFQNTGRGLRLAGDGQALKGFAICGSDRVYVPANARLLYGLQVMIWHDDIDVPVSCTYGFSNFNQEANLITESGMPVLPFRLDREPSQYAKPIPWMDCDRLVGLCRAI